MNNKEPEMATIEYNELYVGGTW
ncbi:MAG: hypothetical protein QOE54_5175, partial [Streptosporangiaceae bacterium]|nr:hypothetical protein [Streptosporangiaceae bacterium]